VPGAGKTLLAILIAILMTGTEATPTPAPKGRDADTEWRKKITTLLGACYRVILIDNVDRTLTGEALNIVLTSLLWEDRLLGGNRSARYANRATFFFTGINPEPRGAIVRRLVPIAIDPKMVSPWQRDRFKHPKLQAWAKENRGRLLAAVYTLARA